MKKNLQNKRKIRQKKRVKLNPERPADIEIEATAEKDLHVSGFMKKVTVIILFIWDTVETKCVSKGTEESVATGPTMKLAASGETVVNIFTSRSNTKLEENKSFSESDMESEPEEKRSEMSTVSA